MRPELLLHPNIPKPLHGMSPRELLGDVWWDGVREWVYANAGYRCQCCDTPKADALYHKWLEAHETYSYDYENGVATVTEVVALCHACHSYIHDGLLLHKYEEGKVSWQKYQNIMIRGNAILHQAGLTLPPPPKRIAEWSKWGIIVAGRWYPTRWRNEDEWATYYQEKPKEPEVVQITSFGGLTR